MTNWLAIDFGGTRSRAALIDHDLQIVRRAEMPSRVEQGITAVSSRLNDLGKSLLDPETEVEAIGISAPGPLDTEAGVIIKAHTLPGWKQVPLAATIREAFGGAPTFAQNDANLGALAEFELGAGRDADPLVYLTLSTGIGGGAIINGELFSGARGMAIEPGHMRLTLRDGSVRRLEELASGTALAHSARHKLESTDQPSSLRDLPLVDGQAVGEATLSGDALAREVVSDAGRWLGLGLVNLIHLFNPAAIVIGGGVAKLDGIVLNPARAVIREQVLHERFYEEGLIRPAALGEG